MKLSTLTAARRKLNAYEQAALDVAVHAIRCMLNWRAVRLVIQNEVDTMDDDEFEAARGSRMERGMAATAAMTKALDQIEVEP